MKETIPCHSCELCAVGFSIGFTGGELMRCARFDADVTREDGCTMGQRGEPATLCYGADATIAGHEAVWGWRE